MAACLWDWHLVGVQRGEIDGWMQVFNVTTTPLQLPRSPVIEF
jgi:hypothetical protein